MNLMEVLKNKKMNNKGSAIVLVIIAMGFIGILSTMILWMAYMNYLMKLTDKESTNNFYSAEQVVEEIKVGLQDKVSEAMQEAYKKTMENYTLFDNSDQRQSYFESEMKDALTNTFMAADTNHYKFSLVTDCVDDSIKDSAVRPYANVRSVSFKDAADFSKAHNDSNALMETSLSDNSILLKNIDVVFTDDREFVSAIHTDMRLVIPKLHFEDMSMSANFAEYSLVANEKLVDQGGSTAKVTFNGAVYGGNGGDGAGTASENSIVMKSGSNWLFDTGSRLVCEKAISISNNATLEVNYDELWAGNISLDDKNGTLSLDTSAHVKDDLTIWKDNGDVTLKGSYYGFGIGTGDTDKDSSAIIINGRKSSLDLSSLDNIWIGGRSYIGTKKDTENYTSTISTIKNVNIPMSESIAIRGNQVAYLVPPAALCTLSGNSLVKSNPITAAEYVKYVEGYKDNDDFVECNLSETILPGTETYLSDYTQDPDKGWKKIVAKGHNGANLVYYYMNMDAEHANEFFEKYYGIEHNKDIIDSCLKIYSSDDIKVSDDSTAKIEMAGNWLSYDKSSKTVSLNKASVSSNQAIMNMNYENAFEALNKKLVIDKSSLTSDELSKSVYENLIEETAMVKHIGANGTKTFEYENEDGTKIKAVVSTNSGTITVPDDGTIRMVLSAGSVKVTKNFKGIIIAKENIYITPGITIENAPDEVKKALNAEWANKGIFTYMMFKDGSRYAQEKEGSVSDNSASEPLELNDLVIYENWSKQ